MIWGPPPPIFVHSKMAKNDEFFFRTSSEGVAAFVKGYNLS